MQESLYQPLFLKYRPQKLNDILGQDSVKETLINAIENQKIVHAYLLTGPRGSGKTSTARIIAKSLNCTDAPDGKSPSIDPCGLCASCVSIANSSSVDVTEIDAASHGQVADARNLIEKVNLASVSGKYRVYIIDEVHMLSNAAFNALLKVIEEPPKNVVFILATTEFDKVPKTISSRCQQLRFKPITVNDVLKRMNYVVEQENLNISTEALEAIAKHSDGAMRDALALLDQIGVFSNEAEPVSKRKVLDIVGAVSTDDLEKLLLSLLKRDLAQLINSVEEMISFGKEPLIICQELNDFILELLTNIGLKKKDTMQALMASIEEEQIENYELVQISNSLAELEIKLKMTTQTKALFKAWMVKLAHREDIFVVKDLLEKIKELETRRPSSAGAARTATPRAPQVKAQEQVIQVKPFKEKTEQRSESNTDPVIETSVEAETKTAPAMNSNTNNAFLDYLSPGSKGMFISSKAALTKTEPPNAVISIPNKFKFLKAKLEARSEEFLSAIAKHYGDGIVALDFQLGDTVASSESPKLETEPKTEPEKKTPDLASKPSQTCAARDEMTQDLPVTSLNRDKLDEVKEAALNIFGGKELEQ